MAFHGEYGTKLAYYELDELQCVVKLDVFQSESVPELHNFVFVGLCFSCIFIKFLHREKVVLGVELSYYVVLGSREVLCCVYLKSIGNPGFGGRM